RRCSPKPRTRASGLEQEGNIVKAYHRALISELKRRGFSPRLYMTNGSHVRIAWDVAGKTYSILTAATPSDRRATQNTRATLRRQLKALRTHRAPTATQQKPISAPTAHLRNELIQLRSSAAPSVTSRIRTLEIELAWRQHARAQEGVR